MNAHTGILLILAAMWLLWPTADYRPRVVNGFWALLAALVSTRPVRERIIRQAAKTPHYHLPDYMDRWWLLRLGYLNVRVHHIKRKDLDRHLHDHPWKAARTIILQGWYWEKRKVGEGALEVLRSEGDTALLRHGQYHSITQVSEGGVWTLFFTWFRVDENSEEGDWGFLENGKHVPWRLYKQRHPDGPWSGHP